MTISGSVATSERREFNRLVDRREAEDVLVVTKLDRLGRNATDVASTVAKLADKIGRHASGLGNLKSEKPECRDLGRGRTSAPWRSRGRDSEAGVFELCSS